jgi:anthranilate phosphoribosyltransferase
VLKHGSRSASGKTGSSEVLEALGVKLDLSPKQLSKVFEKTQITFFFAPLFHPALKHVAPIRKEMGVPTTFNFLGPLANPVQPVATALGVAKAELMPLMANEILGRNRTAILFRGSDGLDELTITGNSKINLVHAGELKTLDFEPISLGISPSQVSELIGGEAEVNAQVARRLFEGDLGENDPIFQIVALNAAAGITSYELAKSANLNEFDFEETLAKNYSLACNAITSGKANDKLNQWIEVSQSIGE